MADSKRTPVKSPGKPSLPGTSKANEIDAFLAQAKAMTPASVDGRGRLIFALDATMSRQPTWDRALQLQSEMFEQAGKVGGLDVQLIYFRGFNECRASKWVSDTKGLRDLMTGIDCRGGNTQIGKVLSHARKETGKKKVSVMVFVGDALEEPIDKLAAKAGELGLLGLRLFLFQEGHDARAATAFRELARLTRGAYCRFDTGSARQLRELLTAVAAYAAGGRKAMEQLAEGSGGKGARLLIEQMKR